MAKVRSVNSTNSTKKMRPALTPENDLNQCVSLAIDLVKQRLADGTASSQETTHFLKMATPEYKLKLAILEKDKELMVAKTEALRSQKRMDELYADAIKAMRKYGGHGDSDDDEY